MTHFHDIYKDLNLGCEDEFGLIHFKEINQKEEWEKLDVERYIICKELPLMTIKFNAKAKKIIRKGISCQRRRSVWFSASGGLELFHKIGNIWEDIIDVTVKQEFNDFYSFGSTLNLSQYVPEVGEEQLKFFLNIIHSQNREIVDAPLIVPVSIFLLLFMEPSLAYLSIQAMINKSKEKPSSYFLLTERERIAQANAFKDLLKRVCKPIYSHLKHIQDFQLNDVVFDLFEHFCLPYTTIAASLTIFDSFIVEGRKVLTRILLAIIITNKESILKAETREELIEILLKAVAELDNPLYLKYALASAFCIRISRERHIIPAEKHALQSKKNSLSYNKSCAIFSLVKDDCHSIQKFNHNKAHIDEYFSSFSLKESSRISLARSFTVFKTDNDMLLTDKLFKKLLNHFPRIYKFRKPKIVYKLTQDGTSFSCFLRKAPLCSPSILIIKTVNGVMGAFFVQSIAKPRRSYFGEGTNFVFQANPLKVYQRYSPINSQYVYVDSESLMVGGPNPAIYIQNGFEKLTSYDCETFASPCFTISNFGDKIYEIQLYALER